MNKLYQYACDRIEELETELAEARARITIMEGCISDMTEEQAAICAEGQSITELVAAKDKLIEQMREALKIVYNNHGYGRGNITDSELAVTAALSAAERGEQ